MSINVNSNVISSTGFNSSGDILNSPNVITDGLVLWLDVGNNASYMNSTSYYDCGYGCQYYASDPGCTNCNTQIKDMSGFGNDGTLNNIIPSYSNIGGTLIYSATNMGVTLPNSASLTNLKTSQGGNGYTVLVFAKTNSVGGWRKLIGNGDGDNYIDIWQNPTGYYYSEGGETLYVDGVNVSQGAYYMVDTGWHQWGATNLNSGTLTNPSQSLSIGKELTTTTYTWTGEISIAQIYHRVLSTTEMLQNFNANRQRFGI